MMTCFAPNKVIYTAVSAPGAGKTQALINQIPSLLSAGRSIVLALPTLNLTDSFISRLPADLSYRVINSTTCDHVGSETRVCFEKERKPSDYHDTSQHLFHTIHLLFAGC